MSNIKLIITAAGLSHRNPPNKLLLPLGDKTVIETTIENFINTKMDITIVTGHQREKIELLLAKRFGDRITIVHNPDYKTGLASSIKAGLITCSEEPDYWCFCNGDKPFINPATIDYLLIKLEQTKSLILVPTYHDQSGHPTFFTSELITELLALTGESGGRELFHRYQHKTELIPVTDSGIVRDMDKELLKTKRN